MWPYIATGVGNSFGKFNQNVFGYTGLWGFHMKRGFLEVVLYILGGFQALYFEDVHTPQLPHSFPIQLCGLLLSALFLSIFSYPTVLT